MKIVVVSLIVVVFHLILILFRSFIGMDAESTIDFLVALMLVEVFFFGMAAVIGYFTR